MSGFGYPWSRSSRNEEEEEDEHQRRFNRWALLSNRESGYLPYSEHMSSRRNPLFPSTFRRQPLERAEYPFTDQPNFDRPSPPSRRPFDSFTSSYLSVLPHLSSSSPEPTLPSSRSPLERLMMAGTGIAAGSSPPPENPHRQWERVTMTRPFLEAIENNDVETVKNIITEHKRLTKCRIDPIHFAMLKGHFSLIPILINAGCDPNAPDMIGCTPLMNALKSKFYDVMEYLLDGGADPNAPSGRKEEIPLIEAVYENNQRAIQMLLDSKDCDVNRTNASNDNETALFIAIYLGRTELVDMLLERGADPNVGRGEHRPTPMHIAINAGAEQDAGLHVPLMITELLLSFGGLPDGADQNGFTPLHIAAINDRDDIMELLIDHDQGLNLDVKSDSAETPLMAAVLHGSSRCAALLLSAGCDFTTPDDVPADGPGSALVKRAFHLAFFPIVKMLLTAGASLSTKSRLMFTRMPRTSHERLHQYQSLLIFLESQLHTSSLMLLSIHAIRHQLKPNLASSVPQLPLPNKLKKAIFILDELKDQMQLEPMRPSTST